jgi:hypothetical protein
MKIKRASRILRYLTIVYLCLIPALTAIFWICNGEPIHPALHIRLWPEGFLADNLVTPIPQLSAMTKILAFLVSLIPNIFTVLALYFLAKLFHLFEGMEFFSQNSVAALRRIGFSLLAGQLTFPLYTALLSLTLTISNPPGQRMIAASFGAAEFNWTALAIVIIVISWIMDEGRKLQEEQAATV